MRHRRFPAAVLVTLVFTLGGAVTAPTPHRLPVVALGAVLIWRVEVAAVTFIVAYVVIVTVRLSLHGRTLAHVGSRGIEIPDVISDAAADREAEEFAAGVAESLTEIQASIEELESRLHALEHPRHVLLRFQEGDLG